jgi:hypothetical protein
MSRSPGRFLWGIYTYGRIDVPSRVRQYSVGVWEGVVRSLLIMKVVVATASSLWVWTTTASSESLVWNGAGIRSCTQYAQNVRSGGEDMRSFFFTWAQGFMSGLNASLLVSSQTPVNQAAKSVNDQQAFIDRYCDQKPLADYVNAVLSLYDTMRSEQGLHDFRVPPKY